MLTTAGSLLDQLRQPDHPDAWPRFVRLYAPLLLHWATARGLDLEAALAWACLAAGLSVAAPTALAGACRLNELLDEGRRRGFSPP